jgi:glycosyltransferase involved in cell wall biosynthesis
VQSAERKVTVREFWEGEPAVNEEPKKIKISATVITFNEELELEECLECLKWVDEIIVVDSHSTDRTLEIARRYTDKVYEQAFLGCGKQKNVAIEKARGEWILHLDADERISPELREEILRVIADPNSADAYHVRRQNFWLGRRLRHGGWYPDHALRLFRKGKGHWEGAVAETFVIEGTGGELRNELQHYTVRQLDEHLTKQVASTTVEVQEALENGVRFCWIWPPGVVVQAVREFLGGPKNSMALRMLYKKHFKNKYELLWAFPFWPIVRFCYTYFFRLGVLDGIPGFWIAVLSATYEAMRCVKLWEALARQKRGGRVTSLDFAALYRRHWRPESPPSRRVTDGQERGRAPECKP